MAAAEAFTSASWSAMSYFRHNITFRTGQTAGTSSLPKGFYTFTVNTTLCTHSNVVSSLKVHQLLGHLFTFLHSVDSTVISDWDQTETEPGSWLMLLKAQFHRWRYPLWLCPCHALSLLAFTNVSISLHWTPPLGSCGKNGGHSVFTGWRNTQLQAVRQGKATGFMAVHNTLARVCITPAGRSLLKIESNEKTMLSIKHSSWNTTRHQLKSKFDTSQP